MSLFTAGSQTYAQETLTHHGLTGFFDEVWSDDKPPPPQRKVKALRILVDDLDKPDPTFRWKYGRLFPFVHAHVGTFKGRGDPYPTLRDAADQLETVICALAKHL